MTEVMLLSSKKLVLEQSNRGVVKSGYAGKQARSGSVLQVYESSNAQMSQK